MWVIYALSSALFAGLMSILAKIGIKNVDANLATALRTIVVAIFAWLMVFIVDSQAAIANISTKSFIFLVLSGLATGGSWLAYFKALQIGDVNKVVPVDKSSTVLTMLLSFILLGENLTLLKIVAMILISIGTYLMIEKKKPASGKTAGHGWFFYAALSAFFASLTALLAKVGIEDVDTTLGTAIRTLVVLGMAWLIVFGQGSQKKIQTIDKRSWVFIILSGLATGLSWLCYYQALKEGPVSIVVPIDKLSILVTVAFGYFVLHEKLKKQSLFGLGLIVAGTLSLLI